MRTTWTFHSAGQLLFGARASEQLGDVVSRLGCKRALVITDPILVQAGLLERVLSPLRGHAIEVEAFTGGEPEPSTRAAEACIEQAKPFRPDVLIGLGGGSNMDLAKLCAAALTHGGTVTSYFGEEKIPGPVMPLVCVPTTAGTGSEVSAAAVVTDTANHIKVGILSNYLRPSVAVVDPLLTVSCPPKVTADSGIDALTHAIEAYTAVDNPEFPLPPGQRSVYQGKHPFGDMLAEKAITLIGKFLKRAVKDGNDLEAREGMALGATLAGMAFSNVGVAVVHALEYPVGGAVHVSHGAGNGLLLPYVMRFNLPARIEAMGDIARWLGQETHGLSPAEAAERGIIAVQELRLAIGIPDRLREIGVDSDQLRTFAEKSYAIKRILRVNPRPVTVDDLFAILQSAY